MSDLQDLEKATEHLVQHTKDLNSEWDQPLRVDENGYIISGVLFINGPFVTDFWSHRRVKPKSVQCTCLCGHRHKPPKGKEARV